MGVLSKRRPFPWDAWIHSPSGALGVMLGADEQGELVGKKIQPLEKVQPSDYTYASLPPYVERSYPARLRIMGMGEKTQETAVGRSYWYALFADLSLGFAIKGPAFHLVTPASTGRIADFEIGPDGALFALAGRYVLRRTTDTGAGWQVSKDLGAGATGSSMVRFKDDGTAPVDGLYVSTAAGQLWRFDGATWSELTAGWSAIANAADRKAVHLCVVGNELWRAWGNYVSKVEGDPGGTGAAWSGRMSIGDGSSAIVDLEGHLGSLYITKGNGVYTLNTDGSDNELFPGLRSAAIRTGQRLRSWGDSLWLGWGGAFYRLAAGGDAAQLVEVGPERLLQNDSEVSGYVVDSAGHGPWFNYLALYNPKNGCSYLLKYGAWLSVEAEEQASEARLIPVIHGALYKWVGKEISAIRVQTFTGDNPRLWVGFADGSIEHAILPADSPNPLLDSACEFTTEVGEVHWSLHHGLFPDDMKTWRSMATFGPRIDPTNYVQFRFKVEPQHTSYSSFPANFTRSGMRQDFPDDTYSKLLEVIEELHNTSSSTTPVVEGSALYEAVRPALKLTYSMTVQAATWLAKRDGTVDPRSAEAIRSAVKAAVRHPGSIDVELPDEELKNLSIVDYAEILKPKRQRYGPVWDLPLTLVEWRTGTVYGTVGRLKPYLVGDLASYTVADLGVL